MFPIFMMMAGLYTPPLGLARFLLMRVNQSVTTSLLFRSLLTLYNLAANLAQATFGARESRFKGMLAEFR
jgi:TRAP-type C4-dicarboxylate transport system permease large subunit